MLHSVFVVFNEYREGVSCYSALLNDREFEIACAASGLHALNGYESSEAVMYFEKLFFVDISKNCDVREKFKLVSEIDKIQKSTLIVFTYCREEM